MTRAVEKCSKIVRAPKIKNASISLEKHRKTRVIFDSFEHAIEHGAKYSQTGHGGMGMGIGLAG